MENDYNIYEKILGKSYGKIGEEVSLYLIMLFLAIFITY